MGANSDKSRPQKLYEKLVQKNLMRPVSYNEIVLLLSHPIIAPYVSDSRHSGGSHFCVITIGPKEIQDVLGRKVFSVATHDNEVSAAYVKEILEYMDYLFEYEEILKEREENQSN